jgi:dihydroorotase
MSGLVLIRNVRHWRSGAECALALQGERIVAVGPERELYRSVLAERAKRDPTAEMDVYDASGAVLAPGLIDIHVHLREPGQSGKETIATGTEAAAAGGFTAVACMPNTDPVLDRPSSIEWVRTRAIEVGRCRVHPIAAVTMGQQGEHLTEFVSLKEAGAVALSDDGKPIAAAAVMRRALEYARPLALPIVCHEEDTTLANGGHMNEGPNATRLGLRGIPNVAESVMVRRDCDLAELTGGRVHFAHLSCRQSLDALRDGKRRGLAVSGETCPHYWTLTESAVGEYQTAAKMNPPLRSQRDREAVIEAIADGTIDCLATDHAPHQPQEKDLPFEHAPFGIVGLETALSLTLTYLVAPGVITLARAIELWSEAPRRVLGLEEMRFEAGFPADFTLIRPHEEWSVDPRQFRSRGRSTPFAGWTLRGRVAMTVCAGNVTYASPGDEAQWVRGVALHGSEVETASAWVSSVSRTGGEEPWAEHSANRVNG